MMPPREDTEMKVYSSPDLITYSPFSIEVPEIRLDDPPAIHAFIWLFGLGPWEELPPNFEEIPGLGRSYRISEGKLIFVDCQYYFYRVMVIY
jgi:hypothetical protein